MSSVRISVVIPLYQGAQTIVRCVGSVIGQSRLPDEIIVVDDGSTDNGADLVLAAARSHIRLIRQCNRGAAAARNLGIRESVGDLIAFLDADDEWCPNFLSTIVDMVLECPNAGAYATGYAFVVETDGSRISTTLRRQQPSRGVLSDYFGYASDGTIALRGRLRRRGPFLSSSAIAVRRSVFEEIGVFKDGVTHGEDSEMWARIYVNFPIAYSPEELSEYHIEQPWRTMNSHPGPHRTPPVYTTLNDALDRLRTRPGDLTSAVQYMASSMREAVLANLVQGYRDPALSQIESSREFSQFRQYAVLRLLAAIPTRALTSVIRVRRILRAMRPNRNGR